MLIDFNTKDLDDQREYLQVNGEKLLKILIESLFLLSSDYVFLSY